MKARNWLPAVAIVMAVVSVNKVCLASDNGDFEYWGKAGFYFDIDKNWRFTFEEKLELGNDARELSEHSSDFGFVYKGIADWLDVGVNFKKKYEKESDDTWSRENRPHFNLSLKGRLFGLDVRDRSRLEYRDKEDDKDVWRYRNKVTVRPPIVFTKYELQPYLAEEVFINCDAEDFNKNRLYSGFYLNLSKNIRGEIFYAWQSSKSDGGWESLNILGTYLKFYL